MNYFQGNMLASYMEKLKAELGMEAPIQPDPSGVYTLSFEGDMSVTIKSMVSGVGFSFFGTIAAIPQTQQEEFLTEVMLGNLFGQGTKGAVLGISNNGKMLTLTWDIDYDVEYREFRDKLEDFLNVIDVWREEVVKYSKVNK